MESALRLIIIAIASLALVSIGQITEESALPVCREHDTSIAVHTEVAFVHPTFVIVDITSDLPADHQFRSFGNNFYIEQYENGTWRNIPGLEPNVFYSTNAAPITLEYSFSHYRTHLATLDIGQYRIHQAFEHHCPCGEIVPHTFYITFDITEELDEFELRLQDIRQRTFVGKVIGFYSGTWQYSHDTEEIEYDATLVRFLQFEPQEKDEYTWIWYGTHAVWLSEHIVARDIDGIPINPTEIPIGSFINVRGFHHRAIEDVFPINFHDTSARLIEIVDFDLFEYYMTIHPGISTLTGQVLGFYGGIYQCTAPGGGQLYSGAIILEIPFDCWLHGIWLHDGIITRDADGTPINPHDIPIGAMISVHGFRHSETGRGAPEDFMLSIFSTQAIEINAFDIFDFYANHPQLHNLTGTVVGHFGINDSDWQYTTEDGHGLIVQLTDYDWLSYRTTPRLEGVRITEDTVARNLTGTAIDPFDIPIGSSIRFYGFPHLTIGCGPDGEFDSMFSSTRMIEIIEFDEITYRMNHPNQRTTTGVVTGFYIGETSPDGTNHYINAIIIDTSQYDWLEVIWLHEGVLTLDASGTPIDPLDIPIGSTINARHINHSDRPAHITAPGRHYAIFGTNVIQIIY